MGYIYVASNTGLREGLLKIGISEEEPKKRLESLSRATGVPSSFKLEYAKQTHKEILVEKRVHSLLSNNRFNKNREFFEIDIKSARNLINKVVEHTHFEGKIGTKIGKHEDLKFVNFRPSLKITEFRLLNLIMAATNDMVFRHIVRFERDIVDGFLRVDTVSEELSVSTSWSRTLMMNMEKTGKNLEIFTKSIGTIKVFEMINYHKGDMNWLFTEEYLVLFNNDKI